MIDMAHVALAIALVYALYGWHYAERRVKIWEGCARSIHASATKESVK